MVMAKWPTARDSRWEQQMLRGFTLIELIIVMAIVALLLTLAAPRYFHSIERSKEAVLRANLATTRDALDKFRGDTGKYPDRLEVLVEKRYLKSLPYDPVSESRDGWIIVPPDSAEKGGVFDLHSGAEGNGLDGTPYKDW
jgi:general secretion pathway protein G